MIRKAIMRRAAAAALFLGAFILFSGTGNAAPCVLPYTLVSGTVASASQVMSNFNTLVNCFAPIDLSAQAIAQTIIDVPGSTAGQSYFSNTASQRWEVAIGSAASPILVGGPAVRILVTSQYSTGSLAACDNQPAKSSCYTGLVVANNGLANTKANTIGIVGVGVNNGPLGAGTNDAQGIQGIGDQTLNGVGIAFGGYFQGEREGTNALALGLEATSYNNTAIDCVTVGTGAFLYNVLGQCDGIWVASRGLGPGIKVNSSAIHIGIGEPVQFSRWQEGITINSGPGTVVSSVSFNDAGSGSATVFQALGTHTIALATAATAGDFGFGTAVPAARMHLTGNKSGAYWGANGIALREDASTFTDTSSSGATAAIVINGLNQVTLAASSATTYASASSLYVANCPAAGTNVTITACYALNLGGTLLAAGGITATLPTSAGAGGINVCIDSAGVMYKKAACP